ncbi:MAG: RNA 2',3'-cyclic phosphodiesterase [Candidatus Pacebacteria bacterium]|nr:RNA 2',3'-cyclic phosphodiesterase [Candidatus Paceibacterota bacterium]
MQRRLFISINLPDEIKSRIKKEIDKLPGLAGIKFANPETWHITLIFLGDQEDSAIHGIIGAMSAVSEDFEAPPVTFSDIGYGPSERTPRMIWLNGTLEASKLLSPLRDRLSDELANKGVNFMQERKMFKVHVTLARLKNNQEELPELNYALKNPLNFIPESFDLMESFLSSSGAEHAVLQKIYFN